MSGLPLKANMLSVGISLQSARSGSCGSFAEAADRARYPREEQGKLSAEELARRRIMSAMRLSR